MKSIGARCRGAGLAAMVMPALLLAGAGCSSGHSGGPVADVQYACDPLAPLPITLGTVIGVGQDADGTLYVDASNGVFVSSNGSLVRQQVLGSGQVGTDYFTFSFLAPGADSTAARDLNVRTTADGVTMGLGPQGSGKLQSDTGVTALTVVPASTVAGLPVINTPNVLSYVGDVANGDVLLATVPLNDELEPTDGGVADGGLSIFYGPPTAVAQRTITSFEETMSGNGTVTFLIDGKPYVLQFGEVPGPDAGILGMFALLGLGPQGGSAMTITLRSPTPTTTPAGLVITCAP